MRDGQPAQTRQQLPAPFFLFLFLFPLWFSFFLNVQRRSPGALASTTIRAAIDLGPKSPDNMFLADDFVLGDSAGARRGEGWAGICLLWRNARFAKIAGFDPPTQILNCLCRTMTSAWDRVLYVHIYLQFLTKLQARCANVRRFNPPRESIRPYSNRIRVLGSS